jgi:hypothetical protein
MPFEKGSGMVRDHRRRCKPGLEAAVGPTGEARRRYGCRSATRRERERVGRGYRVIHAEGRVLEPLTLWKDYLCVGTAIRTGASPSRTHRG